MIDGVASRNRRTLALVTGSVVLVAVLLWALWSFLSTAPERADRLTEELVGVPSLMMSHIRLTLSALLTATFISVPVGVLASRVESIQRVALGVAGIIQTIPSLALLAFMVPLLSGIGLPGIGFLPAYLGLTAYCVLPILLNTVTGLSEVDRALIEAADGVGMTPMQRLRRVELPLALPVIGGGLRTATVWCVGMATLSTPVGAPSLGNLIFAGLQTRDELKVLVGCVAAALLAQVLDRAVLALEVGARKRSRPHVALGALLLLGVAAFAVIPALPWGGLFSDAEGASRRRPTVEIGAKAFTEALILSEVMGQLLKADGVAEYSMRPSLGSTVAFDALAAGELELTVDYTGTILAMVMKESGRGLSREAVAERVQTYLENERGIEVIAPLGFENSYTLVISESTAGRLGARTLSDLAEHTESLKIGSDYEFFDREEWEELEARYRFAFEAEIPMDASLMYEALGVGSVDVIAAYSTDGRIASLKLRALVDDRGAIPPYDALILGRPGLCADQPGVCATLRRLSGAIDEDRMRGLNRSVDETHASPARTAQGFLQSGGFLSRQPAETGVAE